MHNQYKILVWFSLLSCSSLLMLKTVLLGALCKDEFKETGGDSSARQQIRRRELKLGQDLAVLWSKGKVTWEAKKGFGEPGTPQHWPAPAALDNGVGSRSPLLRVYSTWRTLPGHSRKPNLFNLIKNQTGNQTGNQPSSSSALASWTCQRSAASLSFSGSKPETRVPCEGSSSNSRVKWEYFYARHH